MSETLQAAPANELLARLSFQAGRQDVLHDRQVSLAEGQADLRRTVERLAEEVKALRLCLRSLEERLTDVERY